MESGQPITELLRRYDRGDRDVWRELVPYVYDDLRRIAHQRMRGERREHTLSTTALVNEAYLRLVANRQLAVEDRSGFLALVSQTMRRLLVDYARTRNRVKRGAGAIVTPLDDTTEWLDDRETGEVLALDEALDRLKAWDARAAEVVELRYFAGLSLEETAAALEISAKTVQRTWTAARAWLRKEIAAKQESPRSARG
ncbi:MAG TPA: ECF-type sigma factor [Candidatus Acidoferrales bacterium]|nr:ECF-type sigma factor [Candidatus Acidoferrales bacterium]